MGGRGEGRWLGGRRKLTDSKSVSRSNISPPAFEL